MQNEFGRVKAVFQELKYVVTQSEQALMMKISLEEKPIYKSG